MKLITRTQLEEQMVIAKRIEYIQKHIKELTAEYDRQGYEFRSSQWYTMQAIKAYYLKLLGLYGSI